MRLDIWEDLDNPEKQYQTNYKLIIKSSDKLPIKYDNFERVLLEECEESTKISDKLLALEMIARKIEQKGEN